MTTVFTRDEMLSDIDAFLEMDGSDPVVERGDRLLRRLEPEHSALDSDERAYLVGFVLYMHPSMQTSDEMRHKARAQLTAAHANTSDASLRSRSALYLGHLRYEASDISGAGEWFDRARAGSLSGYLKVAAEEMATCCSVRVDGVRASLPQLQRFVDVARTVALREVWPRELARVLGESGEPMSDDETETLRRFAATLDGVGKFAPWFSELVKGMTAGPESRAADVSLP